MTNDAPRPAPDAAPPAVAVDDAAAADGTGATAEGTLAPARTALASLARRDLLLLAAAWLATRVPLAWLAAHPGRYGTVTASLGDVVIYEGWARTLLQRNVAAYAGIGIEYPPGSLPFFTAPLWFGDRLAYRTGFVLLMFIVDALGLVGLVALGRRGGSLRGAWVWIGALFLLGPLVYSRFDLVPAVATIWAVTAIAAGHWFSAGAWLGLGAAAKVYPGLLLPTTAFLAGRGRTLRSWAGARLQVVLGAGLVVVAALLPFASNLPSVVRSVVGYHAERGIQIESIPGGVYLLAALSGGEVFREFSYGAWHISGPGSEVVKTISTFAAVLAIVVVSALAARSPDRGTWPHLAGTLLAALLWSMIMGRVLSPQFMIWAIALGAACLAAARSPIAGPVALLVPIAALTQAIFPFLYTPLLDAETRAVTVLTVRNALLVTMALVITARVSGWPVWGRPGETSQPGTDPEPLGSPATSHVRSPLHAPPAPTTEEPRT